MPQCFVYVNPVYIFSMSLRSRTWCIKIYFLFDRLNDSLQTISSSFSRVNFFFLFAIRDTNVHNIYTQQMKFPFWLNTKTNNQLIHNWMLVCHNNLLGVCCRYYDTFWLTTNKSLQIMVCLYHPTPHFNVWLTQYVLMMYAERIVVDHIQLHLLRSWFHIL